MKAQLLFLICVDVIGITCVLRMLERARDAVTYSQNCKFPSQVCKHTLSVRMSELVLVQSRASSFTEVMKALRALIYVFGWWFYTFFPLWHPSDCDSDISTDHEC